MTVKDVSTVRRSLAFAVASFLAFAGAARADSSIPDAVTGAFETIVIDARTAAAKATEVAKGALAAEKPKKKSRKASRKGTGSRSNPGETVPDKSTPEAAPAAASPSVKKDGKATAGAKGPNGKTQPATEWPAVEVELARARCVQLLKGIDAVTIPEPPFRKGDCGAMAPVRLVSIGKSPEVSFSPPPIVSCDLVVGLVKWLETDVQAAARRHFGAEVIRVESMSDYSCRMAYGRIGNKLSEHGKANALDIRSFTTRKGQQAAVLADWGQTKRDVKKQMAAAKAAAEKAEAVKAAAEAEATARAEAAELTAKSETTGTVLPRKTLVEGVPPKKRPGLARSVSVTHDGPVADRKKGKKARASEGSKPGETVSALPGGSGLGEIKAPPPSTPTARFLHEIHAAGCQIFGTTLGPEANEAHRNHFHVDMAERKFRKICD